MRMDEKESVPQVTARFPAETAYNLHPTVMVIDVDEGLPPQVVIQVHLLPLFIKSSEAFHDGRHPDRMRVDRQEDLSSEWVVVQEQETARLNRLRDSPWGG